MSAVFGRRRWLFAILACALLTGGALLAPVRADTLSVNVDSARLLRLPDHVSTIVIGNPLIADATLQDGGVLVITGKGFGATNLVALDAKGHVLMRKTLQVLGPRRDHVVTVYRGIKRETLSCAHECQPRITLGDDPGYFNGWLGETAARNGAAAAGGSSAAAAPAPR